MHYSTEEILSQLDSTVCLDHEMLFCLIDSAVRLAAAVLYQALDHGAMTHYGQMMTIAQEWGVGRPGV